ncbi:MAG TPA: hypothetical protein VMM12_09815 [Longimicrobiales bacterium]|nr:hypothetical protein [Longimicrobiales bacterium]
MHTEHLQNVHPVRILAGWLVAIAVTSVAVFGLIVIGLMQGDAAGDTGWAVVAVAVGFLVGGWFTGLRTVEAPILHGIALGLTSLAAWALVNALAVAVGMEGWSRLSASAAVTVLLVQILAAVAGCWMGTLSARGRAAELADSPAAGVRGREQD